MIIDTTNVKTLLNAISDAHARFRQLIGDAIEDYCIRREQWHPVFVILPKRIGSTNRYAMLQWVERIGEWHIEKRPEYSSPIRVLRYRYRDDNLITGFSWKVVPLVAALYLIVGLIVPRLI